MSPPSDASLRNTVSSRRSWRTLIALAFGRIVDESEGGVLGNLFPVIKAALGLTLSQLGILVAVGRFARMIFGPAWSLLGDRFGRKRVLVLVTGVWGVWTALTGLAQNFTQLLILYSIGVIGTMAAEPISNALIASVFGSERRGRAFGLLRFLTGIGPIVLAPVLAQLSLIEEGWRYGMFIMGGLSVVSGLVILLFVDAPERAETRQSSAGGFRWGDLGTLFKIPSFLLVAGNLCLVTILVYFAFDVTFFVEVRGWTTAGANILKSVFAAGFMASSLIGGMLGDALEKRFPAKGRIFLMQAYLVSFSALSFLTLQFDWGKGPAVYALMFLLGLVGSIGFSGAVLPMVSALAPKHLLATAFGVLFSLIQGGFSAILSLLAGFLAERYGLQAVFLWMVTIPYAANALYWFLFYRYYPGDAARAAADARP